MRIHQIVKSEHDPGWGSYHSTIDPVYTNLEKAQYELALLEEAEKDPDNSYWIDTIEVNTEE